jgi:hypothetical protein
MRAAERLRRSAALTVSLDDGRAPAAVLPEVLEEAVIVA